MVTHGGDRAGRRVIYVTYDGLDDPLGQSQVRPYIEALARRGHRFEILSFEKSGAPLRFRQSIGDGVVWTRCRYHKRPTAPATSFDILSGAMMTGAIGLLRHANLLHVRSYVAAVMAAPWVMTARVPLLFDMRGLWPDEKVDGGTWGADEWMYRAAKRAERLLLRRADVIAVLTRSMQEYLRKEYPHRSEIRASIQVIPTCTDLERFSPATAPDPALSAMLRGTRVLGYVGSVGTWYMAEEMARFYLAWRTELRSEHLERVQTRFLLISQSQPDPILSVLHAAGVGDELVHHPVPYNGVAAASRCAEAALCFRKPTFSARGGAPTKLGELLACGIPVAANIIGDITDVLGGTNAGVVVDDMSQEGLVAAARRLIAVASRPEVAREARVVAERWFRLDHAVDAYDRIYRSFPTTHRHSSSLRDAGWPASG